MQRCFCLLAMLLKVKGVKGTRQHTFSCLSCGCLLQLRSILLLLSDAFPHSCHVLGLLLLLSHHLLVLHFQQFAKLAHFFILLLKKLAVKLQLFPCMCKLMRVVLLCLCHLHG